MIWKVYEFRITVQDLAL